MDKTSPPIELDRETLLDIVRSGMEEHSLTVRALERKAGISTDSIRDFLRGKTYILRADKAQKVMAILQPGLKLF